MSGFGAAEQKIVTVSCPGKVLVAGGYLVLESPNTGCTITSSSRFYATATGTIREDGAAASEIEIVVKSPQFHESYEYSFDIGTTELRNRSKASNGFVEKCLVMTLRFIKRHSEDSTQGCLLGKCNNLCMTLNADNDFYSQTTKLLREGKPLKSSTLRELPKFLPCPLNDEGQVAISKTGLGSSATLVTSVVGSLLAFFGVIPNAPSSQDRRIVHNLAQLVHSHAQGKIGSGFDVSAAVYGTQLYQRFPQAPFEACLRPDVSADDLYEAVMDEHLWEQKVVEFRLPNIFDIALGDVCGGASSASMAREVLKMRQSSSNEFSALWKSLGETNETIATAMTRLCEVCAGPVETYQDDLQWVAANKFEDWERKAEMTEFLSLFVKLRSLFQNARASLKKMGELAGVGIEPPAQTELVDATIALPGVLAAGVPGAGGNDAVFALVVGADCRERVEELWSTWHFTQPHPPVCALVMGAGSGGITVESS